MWSVEGIEQLDPGLKFEFFRWSEFLEQRKVKIHEARSGEQITTSVTKSIGVTGWASESSVTECCSIEILFLGALSSRKCRVSHEIRAQTWKLLIRRSAHYIDRCARLHHEYAINLPSSYERFHRAVPITEEGLPAADRQPIQPAENEIVS